MATTRLGSKSPSPAEKVSKNTKKPPSKSSKVDPKMGLKCITKKGMGDVAEPSGSKKRPLPNKIESRKAKRIESSKSVKDVLSDSEFEDEVPDLEVKPKVKPKVSLLRVQRSLKTLIFPKKNPRKEWNYIYDQKNLFLVKAVSTASYKVIDNIKTCLSSKQLEMFSKTCFGHFIKLLNFKVQPQVFHGLLLREVQQPNDVELWVMIRGIRIMFSIEEFTLITGLDCEGDCSLSEMRSPPFIFVWLSSKEIILYFYLPDRSYRFHIYVSAPTQLHYRVPKMYVSP
ncbi:hypothetical protein CsatB_026695 [Cannabis sativa]